MRAAPVTNDQYQRVVDEIRAFIHSSDQTYIDALEGLAASFATACIEVNTRLSKALDLLKRGLRSEALHAVQADAGLLDAVIILDFAERPQWDELAGIYNL